MTEKKKINLAINDGNAFFAHELSIHFNPLQFIFDFKNITPRIDPRVQDGRSVMALVHNIVMVDAYHALQIKELLEDMLKRYEKEFGKIEKPKALKKAEKNSAKRKTINDPKKTTRETPTYLG
ncbi:DUF3467 domain-containing protein [Candidatus Woesearchaeota archaeon]|nr:DUF3467 domain-containing protein [Candidatus Woesearchaeota archaeon]